MKGLTGLLALAIGCAPASQEALVMGGDTSETLNVPDSTLTQIFGGENTGGFPQAAAALFE